MIMRLAVNRKTYRPGSQTIKPESAPGRLKRQKHPYGTGSTGSSKQSGLAPADGQTSIGRRLPLRQEIHQRGLAPPTDEAKSYVYVFIKTIFFEEVIDFKGEANILTDILPL